MSVESIITENLDVWTSAIKTKSASGRGSSNKLKLYGIKKLRELILELAVRGKLVPQKSDEEDAHVLIKSIEQTKKELLAVEKIKKAKQLPEVIDTEEPYDLPVSWVWTRLGNLTEINPRNLVQDEGMNASFVPMPLISTSFDGRHGTETRKWAEIKKGYTHFANGDIGLAKITPCFENSKAVVFSDLDNGIGAGTTELHIARPYTKALNPNFVLLYLKSPIFLSEGESRMTGSAGQKRVPKEFFSSYPFPLPPSKEQERIVCKVTELMTLCDQLESQTEASIEAHQTLVKSLLETLTNAKDADQLNESWRRISAHFDVLFTTEDSIDQLKQTILQLAVMGKLVKQDHNDEPASKLLERIAAEKEQLIKDKKIKKQKPLRAITEDDCMFPLSDGWAWCRFGELVSIQSELVSAIKYPEEYQIAPDIIEKGTGQLLEKRTVKDSGAKGPNNRFYSGQILYSKIRPSLSKAIIVDFDGLCSADMYPMHSFINPEYLLKVILSEVFLNQVRTLENRIKMPKLNIESLSNIMVPLAPLDQQQKISDTVESMTSLGTKIQKSLVIRSLVVTALADSMLSGNV